MDSITEAELRSWIYGMRINGAAVSTKTQIHHYATIARLFDYCHKARVIAQNPFALIPRPDDAKHEDVAILSIQQAQDLFEKNKGALCVARLALEAFGGLRYTSASRIEFSDIRTESRGIVFPAPKHKLGKRFYVEGWPDNLWAWIESAPSACWQVSARQYLELKREMFEHAGLKGEGYEGELRNVLRHSFASYHVAKHGDAAKTAILLTHRNPSMLYSHYMGVATKADAEIYFSIAP
jgi:site-specific recombinase XerD